MKFISVHSYRTKCSCKNIIITLQFNCTSIYMTLLLKHVHSTININNSQCIINFSLENHKILFFFLFHSNLYSLFIKSATHLIPSSNTRNKNKSSSRTLHVYRACSKYFLMRVSSSPLTLTEYSQDDFRAFLLSIIQHLIYS